MSFKILCVAGLSFVCLMTSFSANAGRYTDRVDPEEAAEAVLRCGSVARKLLTEDKQVIKKVSGEVKEPTSLITIKHYTFETETPPSLSSLATKPGPTLKVDLKMTSSGKLDQPSTEQWTCNLEPADS
jgi:hypothetical protein